MTTLEPRTEHISYIYDPLQRLTRADYADGSYFAYSYDAVGNRLTEVTCAGGGGCTPITTTYSYDDANRLSSVDGQAYTWHANGNLLHEATPGAGSDEGVWPS